MPTPRLRDAAVNAVLGLIGTLFILFGTGAWSSRESTAAHDRDMAGIRSAIEALRGDNQRILDAICSESTARVCHELKP